MQLAEGADLIVSVLGIMGSLFALLGWLRADMRTEVRMMEGRIMGEVRLMEGRIMREIDNLCESSQIGSERLSDCLTALVRIETELASAEAEIAILRNEKRRERSPHARPIT